MIRKEVAFEKKLKSETSWYSSFNFLVILSITAFAGLAYAFTLFNTNNLQNKKQEVVDYANRNVNVEDKAQIETRISSLNDKFALYEEVKDQSIAAAEFYDEMNTLYPNVRLERFSYRPGQTIQAQVVLLSNASQTLPGFMDALYEQYETVQISRINFESEGQNSVARLTLNVERKEEIIN